MPSHSERQPVLKRGGMSAARGAERPTEPPPKPPDAAGVGSARRKREIGWVRQDHTEGCGVATLAMLLGRTYADVLAEIAEHAPEWEANKDRDTSGTTNYTLDWVLARAGAFVQCRYPVWGWPMEPFAPLHYASVEQPSGRSHFVVVLEDGRVLDPFREGVYALTDWPTIQNLTGVVWP